MIWGVVVSQNWHVTGHIFTDPWIHTIQRHPVLSDTPRIIHDDARFPYHHTLYDGAKRYSCFPRRRSVATWHALSLHLHQNGAPGDCLIYGVSKTLIAFVLLQCTPFVISSFTPCYTEPLSSFTGARATFELYMHVTQSKELSRTIEGARQN